MAKKKIEYKPKPRADIDFVNELWEAANELRGAVAENQYKDFVLSLLFVKHLSERYKFRYYELRMLLDDPKSDYYATKEKEKKEVLKDKLEYISKNKYRLPREAQWDYLLENATSDDTKVKVDNDFIQIDEILTESDDKLKGLLPPIFVKSQPSATHTAGLINLFSSDKFSEEAGW